MIGWLFLVAGLPNAPDTSSAPSVERYDIVAQLDSERGRDDRLAGNAMDVGV